MAECEYSIEKYNDTYERIWDEFVLNSSVNGTFLHTRRFLNYHCKNRFEDYSYIVFDKCGNIAAVYPGNKKKEGADIIFVSHEGSTFGGPVIGKKFYSAHKVIDINYIFENKIREKGFNKIILKPTPSLFSGESADLIDYVLYYSNYNTYNELNSYVDFRDYKENILANFAQGKRTNVNNCLKSGVKLETLSINNQIVEFYGVLCETLKKYEKTPVHSIDELIDFKKNRLKEECEFFGAYLNGKMIAGSMMFYFRNVKVAHTQYLCALQEYNTLSPMTFMYYAMIKDSRDKGYDKISFGISTEHKGKELNFGLTKSKESFGSKHSLNKIWYKNI